jgi:hypothetical protein
MSRENPYRNPNLDLLDFDGLRTPISGTVGLHGVLLFINSADLLSEIFIKHGDAFTKHQSERDRFGLMGKQSLILMDSANKHYRTTRKQLSAAFFKGKLTKRILPIVTHVALHVINRIR